MKEVEKKDPPEISGGYVDGQEILPVIGPDYPQYPIGPTCPPFPPPDELVR